MRKKGLKCVCLHNTPRSSFLKCEGDGDVVGVVTLLRGVAQVVLHRVQVVEVGVQVRVHQDRRVAEDGESQVEVEREESEVEGTRSCMACGCDEDSRTVRGVSWSEMATVPKRKSHRGLDLDLSLNTEVNIRKGWKENGGTK